MRPQCARPANYGPGAQAPGCSGRRSVTIGSRTVIIVVRIVWITGLAWLNNHITRGGDRTCAHHYEPWQPPGWRWP